MQIQGQGQKNQAGQLAAVAFSVVQSEASSHAVAQQKDLCCGPLLPYETNHGFNVVADLNAVAGGIYLHPNYGGLDPKASDVLYIGALAAPNTVNTMPEETLLAFGEHGQVSAVIPRDGADCEQVLAEFGRVGVDVAKLGVDLQTEGAKSFDDSWQDLLNAIEAKSKALK